MTVNPTPASFVHPITRRLFRDYDALRRARTVVEDAIERGAPVPVWALYGVLGLRRPAQPGATVSAARARAEVAAFRAAHRAGG